MRIISLGLISISLGLAGSPAFACSYGGPLTAKETREEVDRAMRESAAIIDAVVERPNGAYGTPEEWAILRTVRVWKGQWQPYFKIAAPTSCSGGFSKRQTRHKVRVVLWGGPDFYYIDPKRLPRLYDRILADILKELELIFP